MIQNTPIIILMEERAPLAAMIYQGGISDDAMRVGMGRLDGLDKAILPIRAISPLDLAAKLRIWFDRIDQDMELAEIGDRRALFRQLWEDIAIEIGTGDPEAAAVIGNAIPRLVV